MIFANGNVENKNNFVGGHVLLYFVKHWYNSGMIALFFYRV